MTESVFKKATVRSILGYLQRMGWADSHMNSWRGIQRQVLDSEGTERPSVETMMRNTPTTIQGIAYRVRETGLRIGFAHDLGRNPDECKRVTTALLDGVPDPNAFTLTLDGISMRDATRIIDRQTARIVPFDGNGHAYGHRFAMPYWNPSIGDLYRDLARYGWERDPHPNDKVLPTVRRKDNKGEWQHSSFIWWGASAACPPDKTTACLYARYSGWVSFYQTRRNFNRQLIELLDATMPLDPQPVIYVNKGTNPEDRNRLKRIAILCRARYAPCGQRKTEPDEVEPEIRERPDIEDTDDLPVLLLNAIHALEECSYEDTVEVLARGIAMMGQESVRPLISRYTNIVSKEKDNNDE